MPTFEASVSLGRSRCPWSRAHSCHDDPHWSRYTRTYLSLRRRLPVRRADNENTWLGHCGDTLARLRDFHRGDTNRTLERTPSRPRPDHGGGDPSPAGTHGSRRYLENGGRRSGTERKHFPAASGRAHRGLTSRRRSSGYRDQRCKVEIREAPVPLRSPGRTSTLIASERRRLSQRHPEKRVDGCGELLGPFDGRSMTALRDNRQP